MRMMLIPEIGLEAKAVHIGICAAIVVLDRCGGQIAMARMDGAWPGLMNWRAGRQRPEDPSTLPRRSLPLR